MAQTAAPLLTSPAQRRVVEGASGRQGAATAGLDCTSRRDRRKACLVGISLPDLQHGIMNHALLDHHLPCAQKGAQLTPNPARLNRACDDCRAQGNSQMPGVEKLHPKRNHYGRRFPASRYDDPRGGRASGLERNILRYRSIEVSLYLFYTEEVRAFLLKNLYPLVASHGSEPPWRSTKQQRLDGKFSRLLWDAEQADTLTPEDAEALRERLTYDANQSKKLRAAFGHAINLGVFTEAEATELQDLLDYRNHIAHRLHLVLADVSRCYWATDQFAFRPPTYKADALDKLRAYRNSLWNRVEFQMITHLGMDSLTFEFAERVYEEDLRRFERKIEAQISAERKQWEALRPELDLRGTEFLNDLHPRHPRNHRPSRTYGDDYIPATGHLTARGVEICYRLFDAGRTTLAVSYLMGMTLRSAERRYSMWLASGGAQRQRKEVRRYNLPPSTIAPGAAAAVAPANAS